MLTLRFVNHPHRHRFALAVLPLLLAACATDVDHRAPDIELPGSFLYSDTAVATGATRAEAAPTSGTAGAATTNAPATTTTIPPDWWTVYADADLDRLLRRVGEANTDLAQAEARWRQALAQVDAARALALPQLSAGASASRSGGSGSSGGSTSTGSNTGTRQLYAAGLDLSWTPDLWGRVALSRNAAAATADAQAALIDATRLALQLTAAQGYVRLRALDAQLALQTQTDVAYARSLQITQLQYEAGLVARADVIQAETQLQSLRTQVFALQRQRALEANALALLAGSTPAQYPIVVRDGSVAVGEVQARSAQSAERSVSTALPVVPPVPTALPVELLRRRPDLAAADRALAAAHARLGVAQRAWLPDFSLSASGTLQATSLARLIDAPARVWSLGPQLAATLFDGGARRANEASFLAAYDEQAAAWRGGVLAAVRETEDALARLATLAEQERQQQRLVALANENERVVGYRYEAGEISFLEVATAQNLALSARRAALDVQAERLAASMALVAALGGGWQGLR
ncbi:efflux transporter outer membrane subunit [Hydrogenophaga sp.]|uniref:efflux transporter outer membrane subunit n=1 Tax=Hydrogenophaga sp. TaxID=1904254 RepID=UPI002720F403|nr:efflux transporter outer membrane subunit [Hydrogenophaga sp.]MDO9435051.1 efflux transporter outer membrane subunit [Hydrogenophaga sp.]